MTLKLRTLIPLLIILVPLLSFRVENRPEIIIVTNSIDRPAAEVISDGLRAGGASVTIVSPEEFKLKGAEAVIILGGPDAYEGAGEISSKVLNDFEELWLRLTPNSSEIFLGELGGIEAVVIAGHTRVETNLAARLFVKSGFYGTSLGIYSTLRAMGYEAGQYATYVAYLTEENATKRGNITLTVVEEEIEGQKAIGRIDTIYLPDGGVKKMYWWQLENGSYCMKTEFESPSESYSTNLTCVSPKSLPIQFGVITRMITEVKSVPAGNFTCLMFFTVNGAKWVSLEVPITGEVLVIEDFGNNTIFRRELLDYGPRG